MILWAFLACTRTPETDEETDPVVDTDETEDTDLAPCAAATPKVAAFGITTDIRGGGARASCIGDGQDVLCGVATRDGLHIGARLVDPERNGFGLVRVDPAGGVLTTLIHGAGDELLSATNLTPWLCGGHPGVLTTIPGQPAQLIVESWAPSMVSGDGTVEIGAIACGLDGTFATSVAGSSGYTLTSGETTVPIPGPITALNLASTGVFGVPFESGEAIALTAWPGHGVVYLHEEAGVLVPTLVSDGRPSTMFVSDVAWTGGVGTADGLFLVGTATSASTLNGTPFAPGDGVLLAIDDDLSLKTVRVVPGIRDLRVAEAGPELAIVGTFSGIVPWLGRNAAGTDAFAARTSLDFAPAAVASHGIAGQTATIVSEPYAARCEATVAVRIGDSLSFVGTSGSALDVGSILGGIEIAPGDPWVFTFQEGLLELGAETWPSHPDDLAFGTMKLAVSD